MVLVQDIESTLLGGKEINDILEATVSTLPADR
jgi:hypothetical protein